MKSHLSHERGQSLIEFSMMIPILIVLVLGIVEVGYALLDQHVVSKLSREGSNLISRDVTLQDETLAMKTMNTRPVNFDSGGRLILSVIKRVATVGSANYDKLVLYRRAENGTLSVQSALKTRGSVSFGGPPNYEAANSDSNTNLQLTNAPTDLITAPGGMAYVTEIYSTHSVLTPLDKFGITLPNKLYSIAYF